MSQENVATASAAKPASPFISANELHALIADAAAPLVILDARFDASAAKASLPSFDRIRGAVHVDVTSELAGESGPATGRLPLPSVATLQRDARRWGISDDTPVVVYDDARGTSAARVWWTLRWAGVRNVRILDGGLAAWKAAGYETTNEAGVHRRGNVTLSGGNMPVIDADEALELARAGRLIDARAADAFKGVAGQAATGHIPGARNTPSSVFQDSQGRIKPPAALHDVLAGAGLSEATDAGATHPLGASCGSGVAAAYAVAALQSIGETAALYPGSWSEWITDKTRPVEQG